MGRKKRANQSINSIAPIAIDSDRHHHHLLKEDKTRERGEASTKFSRTKAREKSEEKQLCQSLSAGRSSTTHKDRNELSRPHNTHTHTHRERERERERERLIGKMKMKMKTTSVLVLSCALVCSSVRVALAKNATKADVLTKEQCTGNVPYQEFATDNRIISCVRNASESCCEAMDELLGEESPVHYCTCSSGVLEDVLSEAVPMFATDIIHERIEECGLPVAGDERCDGIYDDSDQAKPTGDCVDEYPPDVDTQYTCEDQAGFGKCEENWMNGYCQFSCGKCESDQVKAEGEASSSGDEEEEVSDEDVLLAEDGEVLANGTLVLANCTDEKNPIDDSRHDCAAQKGFGKCEESWMDGYCLLSCGKCIKPATTGDMIET